MQTNKDLDESSFKWGDGSMLPSVDREIWQYDPSEHAITIWLFRLWIVKLLLQNSDIGFTAHFTRVQRLKSTQFSGTVTINPEFEATIKVLSPMNINISQWRRTEIWWRYQTCFLEHIYSLLYPHWLAEECNCEGQFQFPA